MLRWGIVATLIWHYTVDASLVGMLLIRSDNLYFKISGIVVGLAAVVPVAYCGALYLRRGRFEAVDDLLNQAEPAPEIKLAREAVVAEQPEYSRQRYDALTTGAMGFLAVCVIVGGLLAWRLKREHIGDYLKVSADSTQATQHGDAVMREHGLDPKSYHKSAVMVDTTDPTVNEFLNRRMSASAINDIYDHQVPGALWRVRYFRDSQVEEFLVTEKPDGSWHGFWHTVAEAAKGANLKKEEAIGTVEKYLESKKQINLSEWKLVSSNSDKRPNRTDHLLIWQQNTPLDPAHSGDGSSSDHAYKRMSVTVLGDEPTDFRTFIKIPDEFVRKQGEQTVGRILMTIFQVCVGLALVIGVLVFFFKRLRVQPAVRIPWRRLFGWGLAGVAGYAVSFLFGRGIPDLLQQYPTSLPLSIFLGSRVVAILFACAFIFGFITVLYGLAWSFGARTFGEEQLPGWLGMPALYYRDAFWIAVGGSAVLIGLRRLLDFAMVWWPTLHRELPSSFGDSYDSIYPGAGVIGGAIFRGLLGTGILVLGAAFMAAGVRLRWMRLVMFVAVAAATVRNWGSPADFLKQFLISAILLAVVVLGIKRVVRFNLLGLFLVLACMALLGGAVELLSQPNAFYRANGYGILVAVVALLAWPLVAWRQGGNGVPAAN